MADTNKMRGAMGGGVKAKKELFRTTTEDDATQSQPTSKKAAKGLTFKRDLFPKRITLPLNREQDDFLDSLAKDFQAKRTNKIEAITANTIIRCLINTLMDVDFRAGDVANTEQELEQVIKGKFKR
jgi:hypothetical protein